MDDIFFEFLDSYAKAFDNRDIKRIAEFFHYPSMGITANSVTVFQKKDDMKDFVSRNPRFLFLLEGDYSTSFQVHSLIPLVANHRLVSLIWTNSNRANQVMAQFKCIYHVIQNGDEYKFLSVMLPEDKT